MTFFSVVLGREKRRGGGRYGAWRVSKRERERGRGRERDKNYILDNKHVERERDIYTYK